MMKAFINFINRMMICKKLQQYKNIKNNKKFTFEKSHNFEFQFIVIDDEIDEFEHETQSINVEFFDEFDFKIFRVIQFFFVNFDFLFRKFDSSSHEFNHDFKFFFFNFCNF